VNVQAAGLFPGIEQRGQAARVFNVAADRWRIDAGRYTVEVGHSSRDFALRGSVDMKAASVAP